MAEGTPEDFARRFRQMVGGDEPTPQAEAEPEQHTEPEPEADDPAAEFVARLVAPKRDTRS